MRQRCKESLGVRMRRLVEQVIDRRSLDVTTRVQHVHTMCDTCDDSEVVCDQHDGRAKSILNPLDHFENLSLDRHIECSRRLVRDENLRIVGDCHCDHHSLPHSTREFMRILRGSFVRLWNSDDVEEFAGALPCVGVRSRRVSLDHLDDLVTDPVHGVQGGKRVLEDHRHRLPTNRSNRLGRSSNQFLTIDRHRTSHASLRW